MWVQYIVNLLIYYSLIVQHFSDIDLTLLTSCHLIPDCPVKLFAVHYCPRCIVLSKGFTSSCGSVLSRSHMSILPVAHLRHSWSRVSNNNPQIMFLMFCLSVILEWKKMLCCRKSFLWFCQPGILILFFFFFFLMCLAFQMIEIEQLFEICFLLY